MREQSSSDSADHIQPEEFEWILDRTTSDLMGKWLLCWVTVVLWVRVARNRELVRKHRGGVWVA